VDEIDLTDGKDKGRHVQPRGYVPSHLAAPALRDQYGTQLEYVAQGLGEIRAGAATLDGPIAEMIGAEAGQLQRLIRGILSAGLVVALAVGVFAAGLVSPAPAAAASTTTAAVPAMESPEPDTGIVQHSTRFNRGVWFDQGNGDLFVAAPLVELTARYGWLPSPWERVIVQERTRRGIRTRATLTRTNAEGIARGLFHIGGGIHYLRVLHPADLWTLGTVGTWRRIVVTTEPLDVD
jgi:hypothetical protein